MSKPYLVSVRGVSRINSGGVVRQDIIKRLVKKQQVKLVPELINQFHRWTVAVYTVGGVQIGYLPADSLDPATLLRGESVDAEVFRLTGGTNWFSRAVLGKKNIGVALRIHIPDPDRQRYAELVEKARPIDEQIEQAGDADKSGDIDAAIKQYQKVIEEIAKLTAADKFASAHRRNPAPINRLSLLLEKQKKYPEALEVIDEFLPSLDPVQPGTYEVDLMHQRHQRLLKILEK